LRAEFVRSTNQVAVFLPEGLLIGRPSSGLRSSRHAGGCHSGASVAGPCHDLPVQDLS